MDFYNLGAVSWWESQCFYHALAMLGREGLIICYPTTPYICLGLHDDLEQEIDVDYCRDQSLPLIRRETGGGVVYLDCRQLFFQLVLRRDNPLLPLRRERFYPKFLQPAIKVYQSYGLPAYLRPPADLIAEGKKCSGNAAGDIGACTAYVGNLLLDFDFDTMSRVLRVPSPGFRQCLRKTMRDHMTTLADWIPGNSVTHTELAEALAAGFAELLGNLTPQRPDEGLIKMAGQIRERLTSSDWLNMPGKKTCQRRVKIAEGVYLEERRLGDQQSVTILLKNGKAEEVLWENNTEDCPDTAPAWSMNTP
ncbi:MAG TPA: lipoate--protein ligase family protein [Syntrophomonadaceae bacterium]|nr:lipoate--protein ligase family protein [Syntrophomonadaceae bacterium]HPU49334.1 lipoate--protein ligase family protein [Syntrophomonadaceae bacterium]